MRISNQSRQTCFSRGRQHLGKAFIATGAACALLIAGCASWTAQDQGDIQTARNLLCNAGEHLAAIDAGVGGRIEVKTAREILENTLHHHKVDLDAGVCP